MIDKNTRGNEFPFRCSVEAQASCHICIYQILKTKLFYKSHYLCVYPLFQLTEKSSTANEIKQNIDKQFGLENLSFLLNFIMTRKWSQGPWWYNPKFDGS